MRPAHAGSLLSAEPDQLSHPVPLLYLFENKPDDVDTFLTPLCHSPSPLGGWDHNWVVFPSSRHQLFTDGIVYKEYVFVLFLKQAVFEATRVAHFTAFPRVCVTSVLMSPELFGSFQPLWCFPREYAVFILFL